MAYISSPKASAQLYVRLENFQQGMMKILQLSSLVYFTDSETL